MRNTSMLSALSVALSLALIGCESHQDKVDALQKEYDQLASQFHQDCSAEYLKMPPTISPKCSEEDKRVKDAWNRLQAEIAKK